MKECKVCQEKFESFGDDANLSIKKYGDTFYLVHGTGWYDEYDSFDLETEIYFCPICGRKLE